jgi:hypothetical protein
VEISGPDVNDTYQTCCDTLEMTGTGHLETKRITGGVSYKFLIQIGEGQVGSRSDVRIDRMVVLLSDALEEVGWALRSFTTDRQTEYFSTYMLMFHRHQADVSQAPAAAQAAMAAMLGRQAGS